ncbi:MAG: SDR family NAD(P)-dependent oxidoreductase [Rikenellaceae bacterium]|nr:SDR family NAD(P)-dependent oxidoreductase [Rikenellaceae bacterium]
MNNTVIIVGIGSELGIALADKFGKEGYDIVLMGRNTDKMNEQTEALRFSGINVDSIYIDVTNIDSVKTGFSQLRDMGKKIELLIYNAVARRTATPSQLRPEQVLNDFGVNVTGAIACISEILEDFLKDRAGNIIFTGGGVALNPSLTSASMSISKAGLRNYALNLHNELNDKGIFVGIVTITKAIRPGTDCAPDIIADVYYQLFKGQDKSEIII